MTKRLTDEELAELEQREHGLGCVELFPRELKTLLAEVREGRAFRASVYEAAGMPELPEYTLTAKDDAELVAYISDIRARSRRASGCQCQWEAGDSPCRVHGEDEPAEGGAT